MRGTIETISTKNGRNDKGPWTKWGVKIETGQWLSTFDKDIGTNLKEGQTYDFEVERKGAFLTITEAVRVESGPEEGPWPGEETPTKAPKPEAPGKPVASIQGNYVASDAKDRLIMREVALKCASEIATAYLPMTRTHEDGPEAIAGATLILAEKFNKWLGE